MLTTRVDGAPKAPFPIVTPPRCKKGCNSFPWIAPLFPWYVPNKEGIKYYFWVFGMIRPGIEPLSPGLLANNRPPRPVGQFTPNPSPMGRMWYSRFFFFLGVVQVWIEFSFLKTVCCTLAKELWVPFYLSIIGGGITDGVMSSSWALARSKMQTASSQSKYNITERLIFEQYT